jgi:aldose 1-epimerase
VRPAPTTSVTVSSGALAATFLPEVGLLGVSLRHRGDELLALPGGLDGYRAGKVTGLPLLAPWANRLGSRRYEVDGVAVDLDGLDLPTDDNGLPIHGTMSAQPGWEVDAAADGRSFAARFDLGARPDLLASFPFPHELRIDVAVDTPDDSPVDAAVLSVATTLTPTSARAVPVAFGFHPYFLLPGVARRDVRLRLPARRHVTLDERQLPTGVTAPRPAEDSAVGQHTFDDLYELGDDRELALTGGGRRLRLLVGEGYRYAQVFTPPPAIAEAVCLEPMTAPGNALVDGRYELAAPGAPFTARFQLRLEEAPEGEA